MIKNARWLLFILAVAGQLSVPAWLIYDSEDTLSTGSRYKFKTAPVDPEDAFRGKYVALAFSEDNCVVDSTRKFKTRQKAFALINSDNSGFASVTDLLREKPVKGDYIMVKIISQDGRTVDFRYPFERYFLEENKAQQAEKLYREHNVRGKTDTYVVVRVKNGKSVIEDLVIGGLPVYEALRKDAGGRK